MFRSTARSFVRTIAATSPSTAATPSRIFGRSAGSLQTQHVRGPFAADAAAAAAAPGNSAEPQTSRAEKMMRRFWKTVSVSPQPEGTYAVMLDKRTLKTPGGTKISLPKQQLAVAVLIAEEWENQLAVLKPHTLPMTSIISRAIDGLSTPDVRAEVVANLLRYLDTDTVCFHEEEPDHLVKLQDAHWNPLLDWVRKTYDVELIKYEGILNTKQPDPTIVKLGGVVADYDEYKLAAFERAVLASKSYLIALGLVEGQLSVDEAAKCAHVEVQSQINRWGEVEDTHDVDHQDVRVRLGSAALLCSAMKRR
ncbi:BZ3500_MvSof-1268-A1-R1_Chr4-3g07303 [Microbotryum saponariae]|uniref:BZ3500_MvSof-1268-A1-R1_Chr4-3g07303 protein n=1 Tax=Microbotryum saponariae TaxID=289078 RepID=A0A2X0NLE8_9BASI|nr:BZ3500_MvSof-1268-A1-R1_Chr4-3g07303 [Microbotryum saponariae]SDA06966.1 BZ3501_MvSof-1269-A2-R1_Chr4-2g07012 [Microbotryum saponariae]